MRVRLCFISAVALAAVVSAAHAASVAFDHAGNYSSWTNGSNAGFGFGAWQLTPSTNSGTAGFFLGNSTNNGNAPSGGINSSNGTAFGLYANSNQTASAVRPLTGGPLAVGQTLSLQMDNGFINNNSVVGISLRTASSTNVFEFYFRGGAANYIINIDNTETTTSIPYTDGGLSLDFSLTGSTTWSLVVTRLVNNQIFNLSGSFSAPVAIEQIRLFNFNAGNDSRFDAFFNRLSVSEVPEPPPTGEIPLPAASLGGMLLLTGLLGRRR